MQVYIIQLNVEEAAVNLISLIKGIYTEFGAS